MGKMKFGAGTPQAPVKEEPKVQEPEVVVKETIKTVVVEAPQNRPSPIEKMVAANGENAIVKLHQSLEKFKYNSVSRMDKYKRKISEIPGRIDAVKKETKSYTDEEIKVISHRVEDIDINVKMEMLETRTELREEIKDLKDAHAKEHRNMYIIIVVVMLAAVAGIVF